MWISEPPWHLATSLRETSALRIALRAHRALVFGSYFAHSWQIFRVAGTRWPKGLATTEASTLLSHQCHGGCSCPHPLPGGCDLIKKPLPGGGGALSTKRPARHSPH